MIRYLLGYVFGLAVFGILVPTGLLWLSDADPFKIPCLSENRLLHIIPSSPFFLTGIIFMAWSNFSLLFSGKGGPADGFGIAISPRTKHLVTTGPYRYSRNPMVFGAFNLYFSIGIYQMSILCIIVLLILLRFVAKQILRSEEKRLLKDFGKEYADYRRRTPRILPDLRNILISGNE
ncbi:MAG: isoprenylcysteine carboxylmethyltransferase family protein [Bacteroidales bacterium]|nr:isoprenylcysteine carboxylmethyltransferase family protein [Bacteroidales bacterium]MBK9358369.1 isoprenylcysteine carboxylmethyltransferase family protein [Bacteroidales bacterium]